MEDERIISKGPVEKSTQVVFNTIVQTHNLFVDRHKKNPESTIEMELYLKDVGFLLQVIQKMLPKK